MRGWIEQGELDAKNGVMHRQMNDRAAALDAATEKANEKDRLHRELLGLPSLLPPKNARVTWLCPKCRKDQPLDPLVDQSTRKSPT
jgi:hypothetical protein